MTDSYRMSDMCAMCGERYGQHVGLSCCNSRGSFFLAAKPANGPESYHYRASLDDYFTRAAEQANRLVFPSGAAVLTSGDKIVGRVEAGPATYDVSVGNSLLTADELLAGLREFLDALRAQDAIPEPIRAPLDWNTVTEFDPFKGFYDSPDARFTSGINCDVIERSPPTDSAYPAIAGLLRG